MKDWLHFEKLPEWARSALEALDSLFPLRDRPFDEWLCEAHRLGCITGDQLGKLRAVTEGFFLKAS